MSSLISNWIYSHEPIKRFYLNLPTFGAYDLVCECVVFFSLFACGHREIERSEIKILLLKNISPTIKQTDIRQTHQTEPNK